MSGYVGDFAPGDIFDFEFNTHDSAGLLTALAGTPSLAVYKDNGLTQTTTGLTLSASFDSVTGLNNVRVDTSADLTTFTNGSTFKVVIAAGTVDGNSVVGYRVGSFSIGRDMSRYGITDQGVAQGAASDALTLRSVAAFPDNVLAGATIMAYGSTQGYWQQREIISNVGATDVVTVSPAWGVTPTGTVKYKLFGTPPAATAALPSVNVAQWLGSTAPANTGDAFARIGATGSGLSTLPTAAAVNALFTALNTLLSSTGIALTSGERASIAAAVGGRTITEGYRTNGAAPTLDQALCEVLAHQGEATISGTSLALKRFDHTTVAMTFSLNDSTAPTALTRAS